jgi:hypothetical protein
MTSTRPLGSRRSDWLSENWSDEHCRALPGIAVACDAAAARVIHAVSHRARNANLSQSDQNRNRPSRYRRKHGDDQRTLGSLVDDWVVPHTVVPDAQHRTILLNVV